MVICIELDVCLSTQQYNPPSYKLPQGLPQVPQGPLSGSRPGQGVGNQSRFRLMRPRPPLCSSQRLMS